MSGKSAKAQRQQARAEYGDLPIAFGRQIAEAIGAYQRQASMAGGKLNALGDLRPSDAADATAQIQARLDAVASDLQALSYTRGQVDGLLAGLRLACPAALDDHRELGDGWRHVQSIGHAILTTWGDALSRLQQGQQSQQDDKEALNG